MKSLFDIDLSSFGILDWGYTEESIPTAQSLLRFMKWTEGEELGPLSYMKKIEHINMRKNLHTYYPAFKSALVFLFSCDYSKSFNNRLGDFALCYNGVDYHIELKLRLEMIATMLQNSGHEFDFKLSLDMHPVLEKDLAFRCGLGHFGKNSLLINERYGSKFIIGSLLISEQFKVLDNRVEKLTPVDPCLDCNRCIEACPTNAIKDNRVIDTKSCIATFTVEERGDIAPPDGYNKSNFIFGCNICQSVCPYNRDDKKIGGVTDDCSKSKDRSLVESFFLNRELSEIKYDLEHMSNREYQRKFKNSSVARIGRLGMLKNIRRHSTNYKSS